METKKKKKNGGEGWGGVKKRKIEVPFRWIYQISPVFRSFVEPKFR